MTYFKKIVIFFLLQCFSLSNIFGETNILSYYKISAGDILSINIYPATEFSRDVTVSPDGSIDLPLIGNVKVTGLTSAEIERILTEKLSRYVSNPKVTISIKMFSSYRVAVIGSIQKSGYYQYWENMNILELIAQAGGLGDYADTKNIKIYRKIKDEKGSFSDVVINVSIDDFFKVKPEKVPTLQAGDIVYIPKQKFTSKSKWISDNLVPWIMLTTFFISIGVIFTK
ncbi:MAG: polysaccharide export protein [Elusimicrobiales bacterium]|nr:polysaccharide export protein [Elusimicrobiales bacterium]